MNQKLNWVFLNSLKNQISKSIFLYGMLLFSSCLFAQVGNMFIYQEIGTTSSSPIEMAPKRGVYQMAFMETADSSDRKWLFSKSDTYFWGNSVSNTAITSFNAIIDPSGTATSATINSSIASCSTNLPTLPTTKKDRWYTYNISKFPYNGNKYMSVLETRYKPVTIDNCSVNADDKVSITLSGVPSVTNTNDPDEFFYLRYSQDGFVTSTLIQLTALSSGSIIYTSAVVLPNQSTYYVYSSNVKKNDIDVNPSGQLKHDLFMLNHNDNNGAYYFFNEPVNKFEVTYDGLSAPLRYASLTNAGGVFDTLNTLTSNVGNVKITAIDDSVFESGLKSLNSSTKWASLSIIPIGNRIIKLQANAPKTLIDLNGADNVTINGLDGNGNSLELISNSTANPTVRIWNTAMNNKIQNCIIKGANLDVRYGIVTIGQVNEAGSQIQNNTGNIIESCKIKSANNDCGLARNGIYAVNNGNASINSLYKNVISDCFSPTGDSRGICLTTTGSQNNGSWYVYNNTITWTRNKAFLEQNGKILNVSGINVFGNVKFVIEQNTIEAFKDVRFTIIRNPIITNLPDYSRATGARFCGIEINNIANADLKPVNTTLSPIIPEFQPLPQNQVTQNIVSNNTINKIQTNFFSRSDIQSFGIKLLSSTYNENIVVDNKIENITTSNSFTGIDFNVGVLGNIGDGNLITGNSINNFTLIDDLINNVGITSQLIGIQLSRASTTVNNKIFKFGIANNSVVSTSGFDYKNTLKSITGIYVNSSSDNLRSSTIFVTRNSIYDLVNNASNVINLPGVKSEKHSVSGISCFEAANVEVNANKINSLNLSNSKNGSVNGLSLTKCYNLKAYNNIIGDLRNANSAKALNLSGIAVTLSTPRASTAIENYDINYNTVYLNNTSGTITNYSAAFSLDRAVLDITTDPVTYAKNGDITLRNNILANGSTGNTNSAKNYAFFYPVSTPNALFDLTANYKWPSNNNLFFVDDVNPSTVDCIAPTYPGLTACTLSNFQNLFPSGNNIDTNSKFAMPKFKDSSIPSDFLTSQNYLHIDNTPGTDNPNNENIIGKGIAIPLIGTDYDNHPRSTAINTATCIGADEVPFTPSAKMTTTNVKNIEKVNVDELLKAAMNSDDKILVFNQNDVLNVKTNKCPMKTIKVYDMKGSLVLEKNNINSLSTQLSDLKPSNQVFIIQITCEDNSVANKKVNF